MPLSLSAEFFPLGYPVKLSTNSSEVMLSAQESWEGFSQFFSGPPLDIRVVVDDEAGGDCASGLTVRGQGHLLTMISDVYNFAVCDPPKGFSFCRITAATAANRAWFRYMYLDTIVNLSLWHTHLTRIHAGCVAQGNHGVLLCGASGAGKSCLTYACARRGWTFISDEAPSILRRSDQRIVIGKPQTIHLRETALDLFPELKGRRAKVTPVGKISYELRTCEFPAIRVAYRARISNVVFLNRQAAGPARLDEISRETAWQRFAADLPLFDEQAHEEHKASLWSMAGADAYELTYSSLDAAIDQLESLAGKGADRCYSSSSC